MSETEIRPCRYVYGEMVPLTDAEIEETRKIRDGATSYAGAKRKHAGYRLSVEEKKKLKIQTGQEFEDVGQYKAWCRATGKRDVERGEPQDVVRRDMDEWFKDTGGEGPAPHDWKNAKGGRKPIPMPWRDGGA